MSKILYGYLCPFLGIAKLTSELLVSCGHRNRVYHVITLAAHVTLGTEQGNIIPPALHGVCRTNVVDITVDV